jgi:hypothetical protein
MVTSLQVPDIARTWPTSSDEKLSPPYFLPLSAHKENICHTQHLHITYNTKLNLTQRQIKGTISPQYKPCQEERKRNRQLLMTSVASSSINSS